MFRFILASTSVVPKPNPEQIMVHLSCVHDFGRKVNDLGYFGGLSLKHQSSEAPELRIGGQFQAPDSSGELGSPHISVLGLAMALLLGLVWLLDSDIYCRAQRGTTLEAPATYLGVVQTGTTLEASGRCVCLPLARQHLQNWFQDCVQDPHPKPWV